jgi:hypothetical protein
MDLGEMADNTRAALNHLAFQLVVVNGADPNQGRVQFPIFEVKEDYFGNGGMRSNREKMLAGIAAKDRKVIDKAQPYNLGADAFDHPLAILRSLTDRHKHREQHVGAMAIEEITTMYTTDSNPGVAGIGFGMGNVENPDPLVDGHVLARVEDRREPDREVDTPPDMVARGWPPRMLLTTPSGIDAEHSNTTLTVAFFGDRAFKIDDVGRVPPYVRDLIARFERRAEGKRTGSGASR